ncbi:MAG: hypothetical protein U0744_01785 [Gemmataceae bacterium]
MASFRWFWSAPGVAFVAIAGALAVWFPASAQETLKEPRSIRSSLIRAGYTRPGTPDDIVTSDNKIIPVNQGFEKKAILGATVYYAVYENKNPKAIPGTGFPGTSVCSVGHRQAQHAGEILVPLPDRQRSRHGQSAKDEGRHQVASNAGSGDLKSQMSAST